MEKTNFFLNIKENTLILNYENVIIYLLAALLCTIPLTFAFGSIASIAFLIFTIFSYKKLRFSTNFALALPILLYLLMIFSILWTNNVNDTLSALKKEVLFLLMPIAFLFLPKPNQSQINRVFTIYSWSMVIYAVYYTSRASFRFLETGKSKFFFFHELVSTDLSAIYMAVFMSFGLFYFISKEVISKYERGAILMLILFILLLSSKSIIFIDIILSVCYYIYLSKTNKSIKMLTLVTVGFFLIFSLVYINKIRHRFLVEYETAFVDNNVNMEIGNQENKVYNISLSQAWNAKHFEPNNFFPGTALRIFQIRIFKEMLQEQDIFFTGFGLGNAQDQIRQKVKKYNLYPGNGEFNFHNQYVQTFAEIGVFGFITLVIMMVYTVKKAFKNKDFMHIVFSLTMIMLFLTDSFLSRQRGIIFFITLYCIFHTKTEINRQNKKL